MCVPADKSIQYRFFIFSKDPSTDHIHIRRWETHLKPREIPAHNLSESSEINTFGVIDGVEKLDGGWLTSETIFQFKFMNNPFHLKQKLKNRLLYVKVGNLLVIAFYSDPLKRYYECFTLNI